jgi:hypothetical protein
LIDRLTPPENGGYPAFWGPVKVRVDTGDNDNVSNDRHESATVGWAVKVPPEEFESRERRSAALRTWLSLRKLLALVLLLWNGYFLAAVLYGLTVQYPAGDSVRRIEVTLWFWGDVAILLFAWSVWVLRRRRRKVA